MTLQTNRYQGISLILNLETFRLNGCEGLPPADMVLKTLMEKYDVDSLKVFRFSKRAMVSLHAIHRMLENHDIDENRLHWLVSDVIREMYLAEETGLTNEKLPSQTLPEDKLYDVMMSESAGSRTIEDICEELNIDKYDVSRRFSRIYGSTPYAILKRRRMLESACSLLLGESDMKTVAEYAGYMSESKFAKAFKQEFGCRPKHFRTEFLNGLRF